MNCDMYHALARELPDPGMLLLPHLTAAGYRGVFVGKWHVGTALGPNDYGFEGMNIPGYGNIRAHKGFISYLEEHGYSYEIRPEIHMNPQGKTLFAGLWDGPTESTPAAYIAVETISALESLADSGEPFILSCNFWGPHAPHLPSPEFHGLHDRTRIEPWESFEEEYVDKPQRITTERNDFYRARPDGWDEWRELVGLYYDFTAMIDAQIGTILDAVETLGLGDRTNIILTTDHGDMTGSHNQLLDKGFLYEEAHHIPLMVSGPWVSALRCGETCRDLVSNMDIFPTILDHAGCDLPVSFFDALDGKSFLHRIESDSDPSGPASRSDFLMEFHGIRYLYSQRAIVTDDGWKYIFTPGDIDEVYDLRNDPSEMCNLLRRPGFAHRVAELQERLMRAVVDARDPIMDAVYKLLGRWENPSGQIDATRIRS